MEQEPNETHPLSCGCWAGSCDCPPADGAAPEGGPVPPSGGRPRCGTPWGYRVHLAAGEKACPSCLDAHATAERTRRTGSSAPRQLQPCGTDAAYVRHWRRGEVADQACLDAHAAAEQERRARRLGEIGETAA